MQSYCRELNRLYVRSPALFHSDCDPAGFRWVDLHNADESVWAFERLTVGAPSEARILCAFNATPVPRENYVFHVPNGGRYRKLLDSDARNFGGSQYNTQDFVDAVRGADAADWTLTIALPPLAAVFFSL